MRVPDLNHGCQDVVPGLLGLENGIGEHAAVPADMPHRLCGRAIGVVQPEARVFHHIQFAVWIGRHAVAPGFVMAARSVNGPVVLRDVEINGPGP